MRFSPSSPPDSWPGLRPAEVLAQAAAVGVAGTARALGRAAPLEAERAGDLLLERADLFGYRPNGRVSAGGSCRILPTTDGWVAANLARDDDADLVPAWLGIDAGGGPGLSPAGWRAVEETVGHRATADVVDQGQLVGLAVAAVPGDDRAWTVGDAQLAERGTRDLSRVPVVTRLVEARPFPWPVADPVRVVDMSSLWAGPLCGRLLAALGMEVVKVESTTRPDGARGGSPVFFERLNGAKRCLALPLATSEGRDALRDLLESADLVIEGSRPRALEQMGIEPASFVTDRPGRVWVSITAYGRTGPWRNRVGFGDDAAAAGGLVLHHRDGPPTFVGDAVADPLAGLVAADTAVAAWAEGGGVIVDVALREVARAAASKSGGDDGDGP